MSKFKVGDEVQVISVDNQAVSHLIGKYATVKAHGNNNNLVTIRFLDGTTRGLLEYRLLKVGSKIAPPVETISGSKAINQQVGGSHYKSLGVQPLELTLQNMGFLAFEGACYTKINKYMIRNKDNKVEQLKKAAHVLQMWIEEAENQNDI
jgi:hypothetical protein